MRRTVAVTAALAALLLVPSVGWGLARVLNGPAGPGPNAVVDVQFNIRNGHATKITRFQFANIPATCDRTSQTAVSDTFGRAIVVASNGKFTAVRKLNLGRTTYPVSGRIISLHKAAGKLRVVGTVSGCLTADTGTVHWTAKG